MKTHLILLLLVVVSLNACAQGEISAGTGIGWFNMRDFKAFQNDIKSQFPVDARVTEKFPPYLIYDVSLLYKFNENQFIGLSHQYASTAGRVYYKDYSGEIYSDQLLHYNMLSLNIGDGLTFKDGFSMRVDFHPGVAFTKLDLRSFTKVGDQQYTESKKLHSITATIQPTVELMKTFGKFGVKAFAGFYFGVYEGKLKPKGSKAYLVNKDMGKVVADWNGFRVGISAVYNIHRQSKDENE